MKTFKSPQFVKGPLTIEAQNERVLISRFLQGEGGAIRSSPGRPFAGSNTAVQLYIPSRIADNITLTLGLIAGCFILRFLMEYALTRRADPVVARQRRFTVRAILNAFLAIALLAIWLSEIQNLVLSLAAVMVALVVATKELIMCVAGAALRLGGHLFKVGDRIELAGIHGEVIDHGLFSTTIMELPSPHLDHAGTGRTVMLPNSILLVGPVRVEAQPRHYAPHRFTLTMESQVPLKQTLTALEAAASGALSGDADRSARFHRLTSGKAGADIAGPGHRVTVGTSELGKLQFHVMIYCLVMDAARLEQEITLSVLSELQRGEQIPKPAEARAWAEIARQLHDGAAPRERKSAAA